MKHKIASQKIVAFFCLVLLLANSTGVVFATGIPAPPAAGSTFDQRLAQRKAEQNEQLNAQTQQQEKGTPIPVVITIYGDRSFTFEMKTPPMSYFLKQAAKIQSGSKAPGRDKAGKVTKAQVREIAEKKMKDLNCDSIESAMKMVEGSARSMGLEVAG